MVQTITSTVIPTDFSKANLVPISITPTESAIMIPICGIAFILNTIEIIILARKCRKLNTFETWLLNLACADNIVALSIFIFENLRFVEEEETDALEYLRRSTKTVVRFSVYSSSLTLAVIAIDRLIAIKYPLQHLRWVTKKKRVITVLAIWLMSIIVSAMEMVIVETLVSEAQQQRTVFIIFTKIDGGLLVFMSLIFIAVYFWIITDRIRNQGHTQENNAARNIGKSLQITVTCILVVISYLACMLPYGINALIYDIIDINGYPVLLLYFNSVVNPLVFFFKAILTRRLRHNEIAADDIREGHEDVVSNDRQTVVSLDLINAGTSGQAQAQDDKKCS